MLRSALAISSLSLVCAVAAGGPLEARERPRPVAEAVAARPLTVTKRSWLDSGKVVPVGTQNSYLSASTTLNQPIYNSYIPARFGQSTLPGRFDLAFSNLNPRGPEAGGIFFDDTP